VHRAPRAQRCRQDHVARDDAGVHSPARRIASLARRGRLVTAGGHGGTSVPLDVNRLYQNHLTIIGATGETPEDVDLSLKAAAEGKFRGLIDRIMPLSHAVQAHEWVESRDGIGKVILDPTQS
jgi:NADPH:quinone reductase-like Zn-dependent oxidoreductase